ncbi:MAG: FAD-dependent oxidoreductase [Acidobacteria bacterium]|nr:FAD-dependent oxidoreductase [Acidobacteriota bacterium]MBI3658235.1 FAD-dependent oxidoreductase [Acidobacteriota bacterium]
MPCNVVILGAGLTGLRAAWELAKHGYAVNVLEREREVGGMSRSHVVNGYTFDHGPHGFFSRDAWIMDEFKELVGGEDNYWYLQKWSQIFYRGEYFNHPLRISDLASKMSPWRVLAALFSFLHARLQVRMGRATEGNTEEFLINQFGRVLYEEFFGPYTQKVWNISPAALDADFARDRVPQINLWEVMKKMLISRDRMRLTPSGRIATHDLHRFYYPRKGAHVLSKAMAERVLAHGGSIHTSLQITRVDSAQRQVVAQVDGQTQRWPYDMLLSTIPLDKFLQLLSPAPEPDILTLAGNLRYRAIILVNLCVKRPSIIGPFWIYFTDRSFNRISEYKQFSPDLVPQGRTGICLELTCDEGDELYTASDETIFRRLLTELEALQLLAAEDIEDYFIVREPNGYPIYEVGYKARLGKMFEHIRGRTGLFTAGRQGAFLYCNQDAAIKCGFEIAQQMMAGSPTRASGMRKNRT